MSLIAESNKEQQKAITHGDGPLLIVAGAGTGKTRVITTRMAWLILEKDLNVDEVLALTFTEKAAEEMETRVDEMLPYGYVDLWISTFHAFCDKLLKRHALDIGLSDGYRLLDETQAWLLIRKNLDKFDLDYYRPLGNPTKFIHALIKHFSRCKDEGIYPKDYLAYAEKIRLNSDSLEFIKKLDLPIDFKKMAKKEKQEMLKQEIVRISEVANAYHVYQRILLENDCLDFGDLINYSIKLFRERPLILEKYRRQFKYILVDEFQDTNYTQYELIKLLAAPKNNITVVGDDDQSIYKFRGASISNIMQFKEDFPRAKEVVLTENYRSAQEILDLAYQSIQKNNPERLETKLGLVKKLNASKKDAGAIEFGHYANVDEEAVATVEKIISMKKEKSLDWSSFAILVRANDSAVPFLHELEKRSVPYQFLAMRGLYNKPIIIDIINYLKLLDNYHESSAVYRILHLPVWPLPTSEIVKLVHFAKQKSQSLYDVLKNVSLVPQISMETRSCIDKILLEAEADAKLAKGKKPTEVIMSFLHNTGYIDYLNKLDGQIAKDNFSLMQQFLNKVKELESANEAARVVDLLELINLEMEAGETGKLKFDVEMGPDMVRVMTIHAAKGLEFDYVFLPYLVERKFPTDERHEPIEIPLALVKEKIPEGDFHLAEERRLFYVAITRAKQGLFFSAAEDYGGQRAKKISRFLAEIGFVVKEKSEVGKKIDPWQKVKVAPKADFHYETPQRFSFSQMQAYETCPLQYKFVNVLKIPTFGSHYFTYGTTIHNTLQKFLERCFNIKNVFQADLFGEAKTEKNKLLPLDELYKIYNENWSDDWYQSQNQREEYYKNGKTLLKNFYDNFQKEAPDVKLLELHFTIKMKEFSFSGRIDRIDNLKNGKVEIVDYKTGQARGSALSVEDKRQLLFYQIAAEEALKLKVDKLTYYYLESDRRVSFLGKEEDKEKLKQRFVDNITAIREQKFAPTPSQHVCQRCDFKNICEFKKL